MSEISRSHVTITLGRGGQVVKRSGLTLDVDIPSLHHAAGTKRSVRDRLGSGEDAGQLSGKRQRADNDSSSQISSNGLYDIQLGKNDLRFKLMKKKNVLRRLQTDVQHDVMDLREKLSRPNNASLISPSYHERTPNGRDARYEDDIPRDSLSSFDEIMPDRRDTRYKVPDTAQDSFASPILRDNIPEKRDTRYTVSDKDRTSLDSPSFHEGMSERRDTRYKVPDATRASLASPGFRESISERRDTRYKVPDATRSSRASPSFRERMPERKDTRYTVPSTTRTSLDSPSFRESMSERRDARYKVLDTTRSSMASPGFRERMPERRDARYKRPDTTRTSLDSSGFRERMPERRDTRYKVPDTTRTSLDSPSFRESMSERRDTRYTVRNTARASLASPRFRESIPERRDTRYRVPDTRNDNVFGKFSSKRSSDSLHRVETLRNNYSPLRERSPARDLRGTRNQSPPRIHEDSAKRAPTRTYEGSQTAYTSKDFHVMTNGKPASTRLPSPLQMGVVPKISYLGNEHTSVESLLNSLGLEKYAVFFKAEEIDLATLKQMGDRDLKDLGIPVGPRTQILLAVLPGIK